MCVCVFGGFLVSFTVPGERAPSVSRVSSSPLALSLSLSLAGSPLPSSSLSLALSLACALQMGSIDTWVMFAWEHPC